MDRNDAINHFAQGDKFYRYMNITPELINQFAHLSGDFNPLHVDESYAKKKGFAGKVVYGNVLGLLLSALIGMDLGYEQVMLFSQRFDFKQPMYLEDKIELCATISNKSISVRIIEFSLDFTNEKGIKVATGKCQVRCL